MAVASGMPQTFKIAVLGDPMVGKTALISRYMNGTFGNEKYVSTVFNCLATCVNVDDVSRSINIWDTSGDFPTAMRAMSMSIGLFQVDALVAAFSVDNPESLSNVVHLWIPEAKEHCPAARVLLVGTKSDMRNSVLGANKRLISKNKCWRTAAHINACSYMECSALTGEGVSQVFTEAIRAIINPPVADITFKKKKSCLIM